MTALLEVEGVAKTYRERGAEVPVLRAVDFTLSAGETVSLMGHSGAGKSTLLSLLAGLASPDAGHIRFDGTDLTHLDEGERAALRARKIGVVLQNDNLVPFLTAAENVELAVTLAGNAASANRARSLLAELGLASRSDDLPRRLSGGEAQRVALAVALVNEPDLLLADEITAELDSLTAAQVLDQVWAASKQRSVAVLLVTHSRELGAQTDRALELSDGRVVAV